MGDREKRERKEKEEREGGREKEIMAGIISCY